MAFVGHANIALNSQRNPRSALHQEKASQTPTGDSSSSSASTSTARSARLLASLSFRTATVASLAAFAAAATGANPSMLPLHSTSRQALRGACEDYKHNMTQHNRSNPLFSTAQGASVGGTYRAWLEKGWHLNRQFLAQANIASLDDHDRDSNRAQTAILDGAAKCYSAGVNFRDYNNN